VYKSTLRGSISLQVFLNLMRLLLGKGSSGGMDSLVVA